MSIQSLQWISKNDSNGRNEHTDGHGVIDKGWAESFSEGSILFKELFSLIFCDFFVNSGNQGLVLLLSRKMISIDFLRLIAAVRCFLNWLLCGICRKAEFYSSTTDVACVSERSCWGQSQETHGLHGSSTGKWLFDKKKGWNQFDDGKCDLGVWMVWYLEFWLFEVWALWSQMR